MSDSFVPDGAFGLPTCSFDVAYQLNRAREADSLISIRPLPFGGGAVVQSGGIGPRRWTFALFVSSNTELTHLEAARGYHGVLTCFEGTEGATLEKVSSGSDWYPSGQQTAVVSFLLDN